MRIDEDKIKFKIKIIDDEDFKDREFRKILNMEEKEQIKIVDQSNDKKYFSIIPHYIVNHSTAYEQSLYLVIKRIAGENGTCWASPNRIGKMMGVAPNTVRKYLKSLKKRGWIRQIGKKQIGVTKQSTNEYEIVDLWKTNIDFYQKVSTDESFQLMNERLQPVSKRLQLVSGKVAPGGSKEETIKKNKEEETNKNKEFEDFWKEYPNKTGKLYALKCFNKINPSKELLAKILSSLKSQKESPKWKNDGGQYIPNPSTWLNRGQWEDEEVKTSTSEKYKGL